MKWIVNSQFEGKIIVYLCSICSKLLDERHKRLESQNTNDGDDDADDDDAEKDYNYSDLEYPAEDFQCDNK